jgi:hypothetical protein
MLSQFLSETIVAPVHGSFIELDVLTQHFHKWLTANGHDPKEWPLKRIRHALQGENFLVASYQGRLCVADCYAEFAARKKFTLKDGALCRVAVGAIA